MGNKKTSIDEHNMKSEIVGNKCIKLNDDFVEVIIISKSNMFMKSDKDLLERASYVIRKNL